MKGQEEMGDRGSYSAIYGKSGGIPPEKREYSCVGVIGHIKVIQSEIPPTTILRGIRIQRTLLTLHIQKNVIALRQFITTEITGL
ncbi:hypothetical protein [Sodaliphilus pleomorphus]|uniref:Uncharacterized protein n=1 Tax=Sodaliphilus pleomorphus TaxID=2606626 RepID=A0A6L5XEY0_9BACT|nr:hypothetical protein [Sodaliphilus pleomorphus]MSS17744.1 hypothetical protein [Sodaliphilus pleomorphus]